MSKPINAIDSGGDDRRRDAPASKRRTTNEDDVSIATAAGEISASLGAIVTSYGILPRSLTIALLVALSLTLINQGGAVVGERPLDLIPLALSFATPFIVIALSQSLAVRRAFAELVSGGIRAREDGAFLTTAGGHGIPVRSLAIGLAAGTLVTLIIIALTLWRGGSLEQVPLSQVGQVYALPLVFSFVSQTIAYRRARARAWERLMGDPRRDGDHGSPSLRPENPILAAAQSGVAVSRVRPVAPAEATGLVAQVYAQIIREFGFVAGPFQLHSASPRLLAAVWMRSRETGVVGSVPRHWKEAIAVAVSSLNRCSYCVDAHVTMLDAVGAFELADAAVRDTLAGTDDPRLKSVLEWVAATRTPGAAILEHPPFSRAEAPEIIGTALSYHYINRMVELFLTDSPIPAKAAEQKRAMQKMLGQALVAVLARPRNPGEALALLPAAAARDDIAWAAPAASIHEAWGRAGAATEELGSTVLGTAARRRFSEVIAIWQGEDPGMSRSWVEREVKSLGGPDKAEARFLLLVGLAPHQIDDDVVAAFRAVHPEDAALVEAAAWASAGAAKRIGSWLTLPARDG